MKGTTMNYNGDSDKCGGCGSDPCIGSKCPWNTNG